MLANSIKLWLDILSLFMMETRNMTAILTFKHFDLKAKKKRILKQKWRFILYIFNLNQSLDIQIFKINSQIKLLLNKIHNIEQIEQQIQQIRDTCIENKLSLVVRINKLNPKDLFDQTILAILNQVEDGLY